jgi:hypothetical protein
LAARPRMDIGFVVAVSWLLAAMGATLLFGPQLGLRGWMWLGLHHALCVVGSIHELRRAARRRRASQGIRDARRISRG